MRAFFLLCLFFDLSLMAMAQENGLEAHWRCFDETAAYLVIQPIGDVDRLYIAPNTDESVLIWEIESNEAKEFTISLQNDYVGLMVENQWGTYHWGDVLLQDIPFCNDSAQAMDRVLRDYVISLEHR